MKKTTEQTEERAEITKLLDQAQSKYAEGNISEAIEVLHDASQYISTVKKDTDKMSARNQTQDQKELKLIYYSKFGNIYYAIENYDDALICYKRLQKDIPANCKIYKAIGDCYRKLAKYDLAIKNYDIGLKKYINDSSASKNDKSDMLNNKALTYMDSQLNNFKQAITLLQDAITIDNENPLYHCNLGRALWGNNQKEEALESFNKAKKLVENNKFGDQLEASNKTYIQNTLGEFIKAMNNLDQVKLKHQDKVISNRESYLASKFINAIKNKRDKAKAEKILDQVTDSKKKLQQIESSDNLYEYYDGFIFNMNQAYVTSMSVTSGKLSIDTSSMSVDVVTKMFSLIPLVGDFISEAFVEVNDFVAECQAIKPANNICKFASGVGAFETIAQEVVLDIVLAKKYELENIKPEQYILRSWSDKFKAFVRKGVEDIDVKLYGQRNETSMQKLGYKDSCELINKIGSGEIYQGQKAIKLRYKEKIKRLKEYTEEIIDKEITEQHKKYIAQQNDAIEQEYNELDTQQTNPDSINKKDKKYDKKACCSCEIFVVQEGQYINPIMNDQELFAKLSDTMGMNNVLTLSQNLIDNGHLDFIDSLMGSNDLGLWCDVLYSFE